jgi:hypothetical protein
MKKLLLIALWLFSSFQLTAQNKTYLLFEFMHVDNEQESAYMETENLWEKIHAERVKNGDLIGWDLWRLQPGGEKQGAQYVTVNVYDDPAKMISGTGDWNKDFEAAYPDMSDENRKIFDNSAKTRDLAYRLYLEEIDQTEGSFDMPVGTVASFDMMKATDMDYDSYEKAESEVFKPMHQKDVNDGKKGSWAMLRVMMPYGSDTYCSHFTINMYKDVAQMLASGSNGDQSADQVKKIQEGLKTRDLKFVYVATLIKKVR